MTNDNDIRQGRHCIFLMQVNLVFVTKYRREMFTKAILAFWMSFTPLSPACALTSRWHCWRSTVRMIPFNLLANYPPKVPAPQSREQSESCFQSDDPQEELPEHPAEAMWRCAVAAPLRPGTCAAPLSKLSANALNNSRRRIKVK